MKKIFLTKSLLLKAMMLLAALTVTTAQNTVWADDEVTVGDVSNTGCADESRTRGESVMGHPTLKLTRFENGLYGELNNCEVNCAYGKIKVICQENENDLSIGVDPGYGDVIALCLCHINIYFTIFNALKDEYHLTVKGQDVGTVSFKEHSVVEIDLLTLERAYEEGFEYPIGVQKFQVGRITDELKPDGDYSQSLDLYYYEEAGYHLLYCFFQNYALPCEYSILDAQAELEQDSIMVINVLTDGIPDKSCKRVAQLGFSILNILRDSYHLRLNHTILAKDEDGQERPYTVCLYEGDIDLSYDYVSIPITDNNDYRAIITSITPQQFTDTNSETQYYDLQGRRLTAAPQKGIYIQNGKKKLVK